VFGAVSGSVACLAAIKVLAGFGEPLYDRLLHSDHAGHDHEHAAHPATAGLSRLRKGGLSHAIESCGVA
jgi:hypothetical protein